MIISLRSLLFSQIDEFIVWLELCLQPKLVWIKLIFDKITMKLNDLNHFIWIFPTVTENEIYT